MKCYIFVCFIALQILSTYAQTADITGSVSGTGSIGNTVGSRRGAVLIDLDQSGPTILNLARGLTQATAGNGGGNGANNGQGTGNGNAGDVGWGRGNLNGNGGGIGNGGVNGNNNRRG